MANTKVASIKSVDLMIAGRTIQVPRDIRVNLSALSGMIMGYELAETRRDMDASSETLLSAMMRKDSSARVEIPQDAIDTMVEAARKLRESY